MERTKEYSLWLMPSGNIYSRLNKIISQLSRKYSSPDFEPHVTLIGWISGSEKDILLKTSQLAAVLKPFSIKLTRIGCLDESYNYLFVEVEETNEVMKANLKAREIFNRQRDPVYEPHLSLIGGKFPLKTKKEIIGEIGERFDTSFEVRSIHLFSDKGKPKDWHRVKEFVLK